MRSICVADDLICSARADRYFTCIDCGAAWSVVSPTAIFVITAVKMLCTYEARENKKIVISAQFRAQIQVFKHSSSVMAQRRSRDYGKVLQVIWRTLKLSFEKRLSLKLVRVEIEFVVQRIK